MATTTKEKAGAREALADAAAAADEETINSMNGTGDTDLSVEDEASDAAAQEPAPKKPMQIPLPGTFDTLSSAVGGPKPTSSEARLLGGSLPIEGQFPLDDTVTLVVEVKVGSVEIVSTTDEWGAVTSVKRRHKMRMLSVRRA